MKNYFGIIFEFIQFEELLLNLLLYFYYQYD